MAFREDYFRRILEQIEESAEEQIAERRGGDEADTLERIDAALAERHRPHPERLHLTLDVSLVDAPESLRDRLDELYILRTTVCRRLEASTLDEETILFLMRSLLVGTERLIRERRAPGPPAQMLADILRQERIGRLLGTADIAEAWRVLFELEAERENFDYAEDYLFHAVRIAPRSEQLIERGLDFYSELLNRSDSCLEDGGLPRGEVERARWELLEMLDAC